MIQENPSLLNRKVKLITCFHDSWIYEFSFTNFSLSCFLFRSKIKTKYADITVYYNTKRHFVAKVSKRRDVPRQSGTGRPVVPLSRDKNIFLSLCPATRAGAKIPGQTPLSWDVPGQNHFPPKKPKTGKRCSKTGKDAPKQEKDVLKQKKMFWNRKSKEKSDCWLSRPASRARFWQAVLAYPIPRQDFELVPLSICPGTMKVRTSVPLPRKVALSCLVGNHICSLMKNKISWKKFVHRFRIRWNMWWIR